MSEPRELTPEEVEAEYQKIWRFSDGTCRCNNCLRIYNLIATVRSAWAERDSARRWAAVWKRVAKIWRRVARNQQRHDQTVPLKVEVARLTAEREALRAEIKLLRNGNSIADQRLVDAALKAGIPPGGCDTPDDLAEEVVDLRAEREAMREVVEVARDVDMDILGMSWQGPIIRGTWREDMDRLRAALAKLDAAEESASRE